MVQHDLDILLGSPHAIACIKPYVLENSNFSPQNKSNSGKCSNWPWLYCGMCLQLSWVETFINVSFLFCPILRHSLKRKEKLFELNMNTYIHVYLPLTRKHVHTSCLPVIFPYTFTDSIYIHVLWWQSSFVTIRINTFVWCAIQAVKNQHASPAIHGLLDFWWDSKNFWECWNWTWWDLQFLTKQWKRTRSLMVVHILYKLKFSVLNK